MLDNIRSKYILKFFLSHVNEKKKLNLIKYNKNIQSKININILNYKILSGNYTTIYEKNGNGKMYDANNNNLIFEGQFLNGKKNGKGKEYDKDGNMIFEGEYLNGLKNGKGKEYYKYGKLKFEGNYLNVKNNGKGK